MRVIITYTGCWFLHINKKTIFDGSFKRAGIPGFESWPPCMPSALWNKWANPLLWVKIIGFLFPIFKARKIRFIDEFFEKVWKTTFRNTRSVQKPWNGRSVPATFRWLAISQGHSVTIFALSKTRDRIKEMQKEFNSEPDLLAVSNRDPENNFLAVVVQQPACCRKIHDPTI